MKGKVNIWETHSSTILSITLVMFLLGLCLLVEYHAYRATHDMQERITFKVDLVPDITDEDAMTLKAEIESMKAAIRQEDQENGVFYVVADCPEGQPTVVHPGEEYDGRKILLPTGTEGR